MAMPASQTASVMRGAALGPPVLLFLGMSNPGRTDLIEGGEITHRRLTLTFVERGSVAPPVRNPA